MKYIFNSLIILSLFVFCNCKTTHIVQTYRDTTYNHTSLKNSEVHLVVKNELLINEFQKTFTKNYGSKSNYLSLFQKRLYDSFKNRFPSMNIRQSSTDILDVQNDSSTAYLYIIDNITIENFYTYYSTGPNGGGGSSESCKILVDVSVVSQKDQKLQNKYTANGSETVVFFMFFESMERVMENTIKHICDYIENDIVKDY